VMRTEYDLDQTEVVGRRLATIAFAVNELSQDYRDYLNAFADAAEALEPVDDWRTCRPAFDAEIRRLLVEHGLA
jgi:hypothetical protein